MSTATLAPRAETRMDVIFRRSALALAGFVMATVTIYAWTRFGREDETLNFWQVLSLPTSTLSLLVAAAAAAWPPYDKRQAHFILWLVCAATGAITAYLHLSAPGNDEWWQEMQVVIAAVVPEVGCLAIFYTVHPGRIARSEVKSQARDAGRAAAKAVLTRPVALRVAPAPPPVPVPPVIAPAAPPAQPVARAAVPPAPVVPPAAKAPAAVPAPGGFVYRIYDGPATVPTYIGSSPSPNGRLTEHRRKPWWPADPRVTHEPYPTLEEARESERRAIWDESPLVNTNGLKPSVKAAREAAARAAKAATKVQK